MLWIKRKFNLWGIYALTYDLVLRFAPYKAMMQQIIDILRGAEAGKLLDVGSGTGNLGYLLRKSGQGCSIIGIDSSHAMLARAVKKDPRSWYREGDLDDPFPFNDEIFSAVISINSLYTAKNPDHVVAEMKRVLKKGGLLVISTPKAGSSNLDLIKDHIRIKGWWSMALLAGLSLLSLFVNLAIDRRAGSGSYHYFTEKDIRDLVGEDAEIRSAYAGTNWLVVWRK